MVAVCQLLKVGFNLKLHPRPRSNTETNRSSGGRGGCGMVRCFLQDAHTHTRDRNRKDRRMCDFRPTGTFTCARTARSAPSAARRSATESKMSSWVFCLLALFVVRTLDISRSRISTPEKKRSEPSVCLSVRSFARSVQFVIFASACVSNQRAR